MMKLLIREEKGASAVEYAMLIGLISLYAFAAYRALSRVTYAVIEHMWNELTKAGG
ncbi:MAG: Flp family type IVb pilin [candidate division WOR-3 bacterium]